MFDYIIVGAGSAGCVLANRLTENPHTSVLLIEAGGTDDIPEIHDPMAALALMQSPVDWAYITEEQPHLNNRKVYWPRGKVLGGSSSTNFMLYVRGSRSDYDRWQDLGNKGWGYSDVLPYFKKAEHSDNHSSDYHGKGGPIKTMTHTSLNPLTTALIEAGKELGWSYNTDYNGESQEGFSILQHTISAGKRQSTAVSYLHPVKERPNLTLWTKTLATRILFNEKRAIGIAYLKDGIEQQVRAKREVILSGGTINSPQLLMLSGVGPANHLQDLGIRVVADVPGVGNNLQDHPGLFTFTQTKASFTQFGQVPEGIAYLKTQPELSEPDIQILTAPFFFPPVVEGQGYSVAVVLARPQSRGRLTLRSTNPTHYPVITANYLADQSDLDTLVRGIKLIQRLNQTHALAPYYEQNVVPGPQVQTNEQIAHYIRDNLQTIYHPVGTCKMGQDHLAVVDEQLRVHGVEGLRVIDASIMPTIVNGNTNAPTIMIAEKIAAQYLMH